MECAWKHPGCKTLELCNSNHKEFRGIELRRAIQLCRIEGHDLPKDLVYVDKMPEYDPGESSVESVKTLSLFPDFAPGATGEPEPVRISGAYLRKS